MGKELELAIKIGGKIDKSLGSAINNAQGQLNSLSGRIDKVATAATVAVAAAGAKLVVDSVNTYKGYQSALNSAAATGGIERGTAEYEMLNTAAREAGRTTVKTAEESANALEYMMLAGWSVADSTKALMPVLKLSAATNTDLATTSDLVTDSMANLGLGINDLNRYLDVSATANNKSNQTAMQLQEAYLGVGGVLKNLNSPIEESAAILGVLANRGTKGSEAGTALSAILVNMQKRTGEASKAMSQLGVSMYDANGKSRSIIDVFQEISDKTGGMTEKQRNLMYQMIGGKSHLDSFAKIMAGFNDTTADGQKEVYSLISAFQDCDGALDNLYGIKTDTLEGSLATLNSAFDDMKISIGEKIAPDLKNAFDGLTEKMPEIEDVIVDTLQDIIPVATKLIDYLVDNSDKVISGAIGMAKGFAMFKLGTGAINSINSIATLSKNLSTITKTAGAAKTLQGLIGTFSGVSTAAGTLGGAITGVAGTLITIIGPASLAAAAVLGVAAAIKAVQEKKLNFAAGMNENAKGIGEATTALIKYNDIAAEIPTLRQIISDENSSTQEVETAKARLQEIADLVSKEYNLTINADTSSLETAVNMAQQLNREDLINESSSLINKAKSGASAYQENVNKVPGLEAQKKALEDQKTLYKGLQTEADLYYSSFENGLISNEKYLSQMNELYERAKASGADIDTSLIGDSLTNYNISEFERQLGNRLLSASTELNQVNDDLTRANNNISEFDESVRTSSEYLTQALANDVKNNNAFGITSDVSMLQELGIAMLAAGKSTDEVATKFAAAKAGYTDFASAIGDGKAQEMAQNFIGYKTSIGETSESAIAGAAVIASQFENVTKATEAGAEGINSVLANMKSLGDTQGLFEGITTSDGVADKLTDMAHAIGLIPESKSVTIDANGNLSVITEAENRIASLNSYGDVDVSVNSNGDLTVLNEATNNTQTLQALGAVALQVNAETGNIEALNNAQQVVAQINGKTGKVTVTAQDNATAPLTVIEQKLGVVNTFPVKPAVNITDNASATIDSVSSKLTNLDGKKATTTVVTTYKTEGTPPAHNASGTSNWRGGLTYVNDQNVRDPRELIEHDGMRYWYEGRNILANVPKGAIIHTASDSRAYINGSHRNGLTRVPFDGYIAELHKDERVLTADEAGDYGESGMFAQAVERVREWLSTKDKPQSGGGSAGGGEKIVFSPQIVVQGNADEGSIRQALRMSFSEFKELMEEYEQEKRRTEF